MKQIYTFIATLVIILSSTLYANAQTDQELIQIFSTSIDSGLKEAMVNPESKGIMTKANCEYNGDNIVINQSFTYTLQNASQEEIDYIKNALSAESMKTTLAQTMNSTLDSYPLIIDILKRNNCNFIFHHDYNFPSETKHIDITLTAEDINGENTDKYDIINLFVNNYNAALLTEIGKNNIVNAKAEYDGYNIVLTYEMSDNKTIDNLSTANFEQNYISNVKADAEVLAEMRTLKANNIDLIFRYVDTNGNIKSIYIDTDKF